MYETGGQRGVANYLNASSKVNELIFFFFMDSSKIMGFILLEGLTIYHSVLSNVQVSYIRIETASMIVSSKFLIHWESDTNSHFRC